MVFFIKKTNTKLETIQEDCNHIRWKGGGGDTELYLQHIFGNIDFVQSTHYHNILNNENYVVWTKVKKKTTNTKTVYLFSWIIYF